MESLSLQARTILQVSESLSEAEQAEIVRELAFRVHGYSKKTYYLMNSVEQMVMEMCRQVNVLHISAKQMRTWFVTNVSPCRRLLYDSATNTITMLPSDTVWIYEIHHLDMEIRQYESWEDFWMRVNILMGFHDSTKVRLFIDHEEVLPPYA